MPGQTARSQKQKAANPKDSTRKPQAIKTHNATPIIMQRGDSIKNSNSSKQQAASGNSKQQQVAASGCKHQRTAASSSKQLFAVTKQANRKKVET